MSLFQKNNNSGKGFMLLEVILSVLIIASGLVFVIRSYLTSFKVSALAKGLNNACLLLDNKISEIDIVGFRDGIKEQESSGSVEGGGYNWGVISEALPADGPTADGQAGKKALNKVDLTVTYKMGNQIRKMAVTTLLKNKEG